MIVFEKHIHACFSQIALETMLLYIQIFTQVFSYRIPAATGFLSVVKYCKIPPAATANEIAVKAKIPPAGDLYKKIKEIYFISYFLLACQFFLYRWNQERQET